MSVEREEFNRLQTQTYDLDANQKLSKLVLDQHTEMLSRITSALERMATSDRLNDELKLIHRHLEAMESRMSKRDEETQQIMNWRRDQQAVGRAGGWLLKTLPSFVTLGSLVVTGFTVWSNH
jgi:hypothetical protein